VASVSSRPNGRKWIQFVGSDGKRRTLRLGRVPNRYALATKVKVEDLISAKLTAHAPSDETSRWLAALDPQLRGKLAKVGLVGETSKLVTLGMFLADYAARRTDVKPTTQQCYARAMRHLVAYFGEQ